MVKTSVTLLVRAVDRVVRDHFDVLILHSLAPHPKSGYDLRKQLSRTFGVKVSFGVLYPHLHALEKDGLIKGEWVPSKKRGPVRKREYAMTGEGKEFLKANVEALNKLVLTLQVGLMPSMEEAKPGDILYTPIAQIEKKLEEKGYMAKGRARVRGASGEEHVIDIFASRYDKGHEDRIIIAIKEAEDEVGMDEVLKFYLKGYDVGAKGLVFIACPRLSEKARSMADLCRITTVEGEDLEKATNRAMALLSGILG